MSFIQKMMTKKVTTKIKVALVLSLMLGSHLKSDVSEFQCPLKMPKRLSFEKKIVSHF